MNCQACGLPLTEYDKFRVCCKNGHVWTLPAFADLPVPPFEGKPGTPTAKRLVPEPRFPAWLPGAVLGGLALIVQVGGVLL